MIKQLNPYLMFDGSAAKAIAHYQHALGAKVVTVQHYDQIPGNTPAPENAKRVIHALLELGGGQIMISDDDGKQAIVAGNNNYVCLDFDDAADMSARFDALAKHGRVMVAPHDTFWGARFGMLIDPFGVRWMFNGPKA